MHLASQYSSIVLVSGCMAGGCVGGVGSRCPALDVPCRLTLEGGAGPGSLRVLFHLQASYPVRKQCCSIQACIHEQHHVQYTLSVQQPGLHNAQRKQDF